MDSDKVSEAGFWLSERACGESFEFRIRISSIWHRFESQTGAVFFMAFSLMAESFSGGGK
jgi:hypothetical protein